jgi:hypothetical protein
VGQPLTIGGVPHEIVGVMPRDFRFYDDEVVLWRPAAFTAEERSDASRHSNNWTHVGRLSPGATLAVVQSQLDALNAANLERFPALRNVLVEAGFRSAAQPVVGARRRGALHCCGAAWRACCSSASSTWPR